ncbi:hypothetical protein Scep_012394 [Stephania cephalantha]|uniref:Uncharacterized protein n=1 Tax=Stephania cephalantha TaxID=152367 RepID=A0AAP0P9T6_9MAGN
MVEIEKALELKEGFTVCTEVEQLVCPNEEDDVEVAGLGSSTDDGRPWLPMDNRQQKIGSQSDGGDRINSTSTCAEDTPRRGDGMAGIITKQIEDTAHISIYSIVDSEEGTRGTEVDMGKRVEAAIGVPSLNG